MVGFYQIFKLKLQTTWIIVSLGRQTNEKCRPKLSVKFLGKLSRLGLAVDYSMLRLLTEGAKLTD